MSNCFMRELDAEEITRAITELCVTANHLVASHLSTERNSANTAVAIEDRAICHLNRLFFCFALSC